MHSDDAFRAEMKELGDDDEASWAAVRAAGYEFTLSEFRQGQEIFCEEQDLIENKLFLRR